jgi:hypothetical protein
VKKKIRNNRKGLKKRLSLIMLVYLDGLSEKKRKKVEKYLEGKIGSVVDYYFGQLKNKKRQSIVLPILKKIKSDNELSNTEILMGDKIITPATA